MDKKFDEMNNQMRPVGGNVDGECTTDKKECNCNSWDCNVCFPQHVSDDAVEQAIELCEECGERHAHGMCDDIVLVGETNDNDVNDNIRGYDSPLSFGSLNLKEDTMEYEGDEEIEKDDPEIDMDGLGNRDELISSIKYMQDMGLTSSSEYYSEDQLEMMGDEELGQVYTDVTGNQLSETFENHDESDTVTINDWSGLEPAGFDKVDVAIEYNDDGSDIASIYLASDATVYDNFGMPAGTYPAGTELKNIDGVTDEMIQQLVHNSKKQNELSMPMMEAKDAVDEEDETDEDQHENTFEGADPEVLSWMKRFGMRQ